MKIDCMRRSGEEIAAEVRNINEFPCTITIYDRTFQVASRDEALVLSYGIEIGYFVRTENEDIDKDEQSLYESEFDDG